MPLLRVGGFASSSSGWSTARSGFSKARNATVNQQLPFPTDKATWVHLKCRKGPCVRSKGHRVAGTETLLLSKAVEQLAVAKCDFGLSPDKIGPHSSPEMGSWAGPLTCWAFDCSVVSHRHGAHGKCRGAGVVPIMLGSLYHPTPPPSKKKITVCPEMAAPPHPVGHYEGTLGSAWGWKCSQRALNSCGNWASKEVALTLSGNCGEREGPL